MSLIVLVAVFAILFFSAKVLLYLIIHDNSKRKHKARYYNPYKTVDGYENLELKGIYYRKLSNRDMGLFYGYAMAESDNQYDKYAVSVYNERGVLVGYAPDGNYSLHEYILKHGGSVRAFGAIWKDEDDEDEDGEGRFRGRVNIQFD